MKNVFRAALAGTAATALLALGAASSASAVTEPKAGQWSNWETTTETYVYPKGYACKDKIVEKARSTDRYKEVKPGVIVTETKNSKSKFYGKHGKTYKTNLNGRSKLDFTSKEDGSILILKAWGKSLGQGNGVYGILLTDGYIKVKIKNANSENGHTVVSANLLQVKSAKQLCYKLGSKPVWGKNLPVPEEEREGTGPSSVTANGIASSRR